MSRHRTRRAQLIPMSNWTPSCTIQSPRHDLVMSWVNKAYGHLRMGRRLLHSSCDFLALPHETPDHWRLALKAHKTHSVVSSPMTGPQKPGTNASLRLSTGMQNQRGLARSV